MVLALQYPKLWKKRKTGARAGDTGASPLDQAAAR